MTLTFIVQIILGKTAAHELSSILHFLCFFMHLYIAPVMFSVWVGACITASHKCPRSSTKQSLILMGRVYLLFTGISRTEIFFLVILWYIRGHFYRLFVHSTSCSFLIKSATHFATWGILHVLGTHCLVSFVPSRIFLTYLLMLHLLTTIH